MSTHSIHTAFVTGGSGFVGRNLIRRLVADGVVVRALGRSDTALATVTELGATGVRGDLDDRRALLDGMRGADTVFHSAAFVDDWDPEGIADRINVDGTRNVLQTALEAGVAAVVHVSTEAVLIGGPPPINADETWPLPEHPIGPYPRTKGLAEGLCRDAAAAGQRVVIVRPRFIWGNDDSTLLPRLAEATQKRLLRWFDGGTYKTSTCHVDNCVEGMILAAQKGRSGEAYFLTDGEPVVFKDFVGAMLRTQGVEPPTGSAPFWLISALADLSELVYRLPLPGRPQLTRSGLALFGTTVTVNDAKARSELGYTSPTSIRDGLDDLERRKG